MTINQMSCSMLAAGSLILVACATVPINRPWNFPSAQEWNQGLEFAWQNAVDNYRSLSAPKKQRWDAIMQSYQPDFSEDLNKFIKKDK